MDNDYAPPWRRWTNDGRLGPWYGPMSAGENEAARRRYSESRAGGGLWQPDPVTPKEAAMAASRKYHDAVMAWVERYSHRLSMRELEVCFFFFRDGKTVARIASLMEVKPGTVSAMVAHLRRRALSGAEPPDGSMPDGGSITGDPAGGVIDLDRHMGDIGD